MLAAADQTATSCLCATAQIELLTDRLVARACNSATIYSSKNPLRDSATRCCGAHCATAILQHFCAKTHCCGGDWPIDYTANKNGLDSLSLVDVVGRSQIPLTGYQLL